MENIDKFNYYVGLIFSTLHDSFPCRVDLNFHGMAECEQCDETYKNGVYTGLFRKGGEIVDMKDELNFIFETARWLDQTGYLIGNVGHGQHAWVAHVTLSPKGLEILKVAPSSINDISKKSTIAADLKDALNSAAKEKVADIASTALSCLYRIGWENILR